MSKQANQIVSPIVCKPIVKGQQNISMLAPLAGVTQQDTKPFASPWQFIGAGSAMQVCLNLANFVGTLAVHLETVGDVTRPPRILGLFKQTPGVAGTVELSGAMPVCDDYVRVVATPGAASGQT